MALMLAVMELSQGHNESALKSERCGKAWARKKQAARGSGAVMTTNLPRWVEECGGRLLLTPERTAVVRRVFKLAADGYGVCRSSSG